VTRCVAAPGLMLVLVCSMSVAAVDYRHGVTFVGELKYPPDFEHFDYVNPQAPKAGRLQLPIQGTWDSFNNFVGRGRTPTGVDFGGSANLIYDRWLERSADEPTSQYLRLAEGVAVADDYSWVQFKLRDAARWHDGRPLTVDDVIFSFNTYKEHGSAAIKTLLNGIGARVSSQRFTPSAMPGFQLLRMFGSASADMEFGQNWPGVKNPTLDFLIEQMIGAQTENQLVAAARAFDRITLWNFYHVPGLVRPGYRLTYWDRFGQPKTEPLSRPTYLDTWWWDAERAARVDAGMTALDAPDEG